MAELKDKDLQQVDGGFEFNVPDSKKEYEPHFYDGKPLTPEELLDVTAGTDDNPFNGCPGMEGTPELPSKPFVLDNIDDLNTLNHITNGDN